MSFVGIISEDQQEQFEEGKNVVESMLVDNFILNFIYVPSKYWFKNSLLGLFCTLPK